VAQGYETVAQDYETVAQGYETVAQDDETVAQDDETVAQDDETVRGLRRIKTRKSDDLAHGRPTAVHDDEPMAHRPRTDSFRPGAVAGPDTDEGPGGGEGAP